MRRGRRAPEPRLPGDPDARRRVGRILRVDHAGEYGARRIYEGQLAVLGHAASGDAIREMAACEDRHLAAFDRDLRERGERPTALLPLWRVAGYALGAATALAGPEAAMACTEAVEEVIDGHYARQHAELRGREPALRRRIAAFRADEIAHRDEARRRGARRAPAYRLLKGGVRLGTRAAIWLSERA